MSREVEKLRQRIQYEDGRASIDRDRLLIVFREPDPELRDVVEKIANATKLALEREPERDCIRLSQTGTLRWLHGPGAVERIAQFDEGLSGRGKASFVYVGRRGRAAPRSRFGVDPWCFDVRPRRATDLVRLCGRGVRINPVPMGAWHRVELGPESDYEDVLFQASRIGHVSPRTYSLIVPHATIHEQQPFYPQQTNLHFIHPLPVWNAEYQGALPDVKVFVIDTGVFNVPGEVTRDAALSCNIDMAPSGPPYPLGGAPVGASDSHGTEAAGIIAGAATNPPMGMTGIAPQCRLVSLRCNASLSDVADAIEHAVTLVNHAAGERGVVHVGFDVLDLFADDPLNTKLPDALDSAAANDFVVVIPSGNHAVADPGDELIAESSPLTSLSRPSVLIVGALTGAEHDLRFSNALVGYASRFGPSLSLAAPGGPDLLTTHSVAQPYTDAVALKSWGTSVAAAHVTGAVAQIRAIRPNLEAPDVRTLLLATACPVRAQTYAYGQAPALRDGYRHDEVGAGRLNAGAAAIEAQAGRLTLAPGSIVFPVTAAGTKSTQSFTLTNESLPDAQPRMVRVSLRLTSISGGAFRLLIDGVDCGVGPVQGGLAPGAKAIDIQFTAPPGGAGTTARATLKVDSNCVVATPGKARNISVRAPVGP